MPEKRKEPESQEKKETHQIRAANNELRWALSLSALIIHSHMFNIVKYQLILTTLNLCMDR